MFNVTVYKKKEGTNTLKKNRTTIPPFSSLDLCYNSEWYNGSKYVAYCKEYNWHHAIGVAVSTKMGIKWQKLKMGMQKIWLHVLNIYAMHKLFIIFYKENHIQFKTIISWKFNITIDCKFGFLNINVTSLGKVKYGLVEKVKTKLK